MSERLVKVDEIEDSETEERLKLLRKFIGESDALNKAILIMDLDGISHAEISEAMGISLSNVGTKIARIKEQLKMKKISLQEIWKQNEMVLENTRSLNLALLKEVKLDKVKRSLNNLFFLPISTMVFLGLVASYAIYFAVENLENWYFIFSGGVVAFFSVMLVVSSIMQLIQILTIDYNEPVLKLQKDISRIKLSVV